jgi:hypothetical protein
MRLLLYVLTAPASFTRPSLRCQPRKHICKYSPFRSSS